MVGWLIKLIPILALYFLKTSMNKYCRNTLFFELSGVDLMAEE